VKGWFVLENLKNLANSGDILVQVTFWESKKQYRLKKE
jgi:hypothetical protein